MHVYSNVIGIEKNDNTYPSIGYSILDEPIVVGF